MAKQGQTTIRARGLETSRENTGLEGLTAAASNAAKAGPAKGLPPVHLWNPPFCGDLDMRIAGDGTWFYMGTPIGRPALVRLFSTILKREDGKHFLVTPVEKVGIRVDDAPFLAVEMLKEERRSGPAAAVPDQCRRLGGLRCRARLRFKAAADGGLTPYLHVRADLWAKVTRAIYYDLVDIGEERVVDGHPMFGIASGGDIFCDGRCGAGEGRALNGPMLKTEPAAVQFGGVLRARPRAAALRCAAGADRRRHRAAERRSRHRSHAGNHRARTADPARGGADRGGGSRRSRPCC